MKEYVPPGSGNRAELHPALGMELHLSPEEDPLSARVLRAVYQGHGGAQLSRPPGRDGIKIR